MNSKAVYEQKSASDPIEAAGRRFRVCRLAPWEMRLAHDLSEDLQKKYGYDPQKTATFTTTTAIVGANAGKFEQPKTPFPWQLQDTEKVFLAFYAGGHPEPRDQFETQAEYEARLPKPLDTQRVLHFAVTAHANHSYDVERELLTVSGGDNGNPHYYEYKLVGGVTRMFQAALGRLSPMANDALGETRSTFSASNPAPECHVADKRDARPECGP